jgi:hypothetical protein
MEKCIVICCGSKHSAWDTISEAKTQVSVLKDLGYRDAHLTKLDHNYENGHYFV